MAENDEGFSMNQIIAIVAIPICLVAPYMANMADYSFIQKLGTSFVFYFLFLVLFGIANQSEQEAKDEALKRRYYRKQLDEN
ncbi:MAG: hypothetical protein ACR2NI_00100 [Pirellulales bacterium]